MTTKVELSKDITYINWIDSTFTGGPNGKGAIFLTENHSYIESPPNFIGSLMPHQSRLVKAALDLENRRIIKLSCVYNFNERISQHKNKNILLETTVGKIADPLGSGKTIEIIAIILHNPIPRYTSINSIYSLENIHDYSNSSGGFVMGAEIRRKINYVLIPNLILVASSVIKQWEKAIKTFSPDLYAKTMIVSDIYGIRNLQKSIEDTSIQNYTIILVKNKTITGNIDLGDESIVKTKVKYIINAIASISRGYIWSRLIIDDADTINMPLVCGTINARFTWIVSSTNSKFQRSFNEPDEETTHDLCKNIYYENNILNALLRSSELNTYFTLKNDPEFIQKSVKIGTPLYYLYKFVNPNDRIIRMVGGIGDAQSQEIMQMLNSDCLDAAAHSLNIVGESVRDIFKRLLKNKYEAYKKAKSSLEFIKKVNNVISTLPVSEKSTTVEKIQKLKIPKFNYNNLIDILKEFNFQQNAIFTENKKAIDRVKEQIGDKECQICCENLDNTDFMIMSACCDLVACNSCMINSRQKTRDDIIINCMRCRAVCSISQTLYIKKGFNLDAIMEEKEESSSDEKDELIDPEIKPEIKPVSKLDDKYNCIVQIIGNENPKAETITYSSAALTTSPHILPDAPVDKRKFVVFASFDMALNKLREALNIRKYKSIQLSGTFRQIHDQVEQFRTSDINILLINSTQYCAGLNIQFATDIIFIHRIFDKGIENQVLGRLQRIGREYKMKVHFIMYENERHDHYL